MSVNVPLSPSRCGRDASVLTSEISAPSLASSHRWRLRCHCRAGGKQKIRCQWAVATSGIYKDRVTGETHHLHHFHLRIQAQMVQKHLEVFLHLNGVVIHLGHCEDSHLTLPPYLQRQNINGNVSEWNWQWLQYTVLAVGHPGSWYSCGCFITKKIQPHTSKTMYGWVLWSFIFLDQEVLKIKFLTE